jgi:RES domain-containing protein
MPVVAGPDLRTPPITSLRQFDTCRLIPTRFADVEDSVLSALAEDAHHLQDLFQLDNATNGRLLAERGTLPGIGVDELVFGIPNFRIINAAFTYPRPEGSRFNTGTRGAWYAAFEFETALAEVVFHKTVEYHEVNYFQDSVSYQVFLADFSHSFHDLRGQSEFADCLDPGSYVQSQELAAELLSQGSLGLVYPSVRCKGGSNLACFRPALVGNVRKAAAYCLSWSGGSNPRVERVIG